MRPLDAALPPDASACSTRSGATPARSRKLHLFGQLKRITKRVARQLPGLQGRHLSGAAHVPGAGRHGLRADHRRHHPQPSSASGPIKAVLDPYNPTGSTRARQLQHLEGRTAGRPIARRCHVNWVILDSDWEAEFCRVAEAHPRVRAYVKNHNLGLEVPYRYGSETRTYLPDFIVLVDDGHGDGRPAAPGRRDQGLPAARTPRRRRRRWRPTGCRA